MRSGGHQCGLRGASGRGKTDVFVKPALIGPAHACMRGLRLASVGGKLDVFVKPALIGPTHALWRSSMWIARSF